MSPRPDDPEYWEWCRDKAYGEHFEERYEEHYEDENENEDEEEF